MPIREEKVKVENPFAGMEPDQAQLAKEIGWDASTAATISIAVSLKRIADSLQIVEAYIQNQTW